MEIIVVKLRVRFPSHRIHSCRLHGRHKVRTIHFSALIPPCRRSLDRIQPNTATPIVTE